MTYHLTNARSRRARARYRARGRGGLGGLFDFVDDVIGEVIIGTGAGSIQDARGKVCAVDADGAVAAMSAQISDLDKTWNPTGFYTVDDLTTVMVTMQQYTGAALDKGTEALSSVDIRDSDHELSAKVWDKAYGAFSDQQAKGDVYFNAIKGAQAAGKDTVDAPGLKFWVVGMLRAAQELTRAAFFVSCNKSTLERVSGFLNQLLDKVIAVVVQVVGVAASLAKDAFKAADGLFTIVATVLKYAPYLLLIGGGVYLYRQYKAR